MRHCITCAKPLIQREREVASAFKIRRSCGRECFATRGSLDRAKAPPCDAPKILGAGNPSGKNGSTRKIGAFRGWLERREK